MRIALHPTSEVGIKAGRLLLGERDLEAIGIIRRPVTDRDPRVSSTNGMFGFDVFVTDDPDLELVDEAIAAGIPVVTWVDAGGVDLGNAEVPVMTGANLSNGIARALGAREAARGAIPDVIAWTEPGSPLRSGEPVTFPDPVGARWGRVRFRTGTTTEVVVPVGDEWAGVVIRVTEDGATRILGIADLASHLEALSLAAGAVVMAAGSHQPGRVQPSDIADDYLLAALRAGLDIASFTKS
jgi:hypothetical protein